MKQIRLLKVREYIDENGESPFREWLNTLELTTKARIQSRIFRVESGNLGDYKSVGTGVMELRFNFGSGYRVYFGMDSATLVLLLIGGDKASQRRDIKRA